MTLTAETTKDILKVRIREILEKTPIRKIYADQMRYNIEWLDAIEKEIDQEIEKTIIG